MTLPDFPIVAPDSRFLLLALGLTLACAGFFNGCG